MNITLFALSNRAFVVALMFILVAGGFYSFDKISKLEDPEITVKQAVVLTTYPGASAHQVELELTMPLEDAVRTMGQLESVESKSMPDYSLITVTLKTTVKDKDLQQKWDILRRKVNDVAANLPANASKPVVMDDFGDVYGMFFAMTVDGYSETQITDYANMIKREIKGIKGVGQVALYGLKTPTIDIEMTQSKMASLGILPSEVLMAIDNNNKPTYAGYFTSGNQRLRTNVSGTYNNIDDIKNTLISGHEGERIKLEDIATIKKGLESPTRTEMLYDGKRAIGISISMISGYDITKVGEEVSKQINDIKLPAGIGIQKVFYQPDKVNDAIGNFMINLALSVLIVIFVLVFSMGWRSGVIIGVSLFMTIMGSVLILHMLNGTLQRVSLAAFILGMGMLVDNAIVIVDGILLDNDRGIKRPLLLTNTATKTAMPLLGATLIAILAFFPIFLSPDTAGVYVRDLFIVLAVSLLLSWVLALVQVPVQANMFLKLEQANPNQHNKENMLLRLFRRTVTYVLTHRLRTLGVIILFVILSLWGFTYVKQGFFPDMVYDQLYIEYTLDEGKTSDAVKNDLQQIEQYLLSQNQIKHVTTSIGATPSRYNLVRTVSDPALNYGELIVDFTTSKELDNSISEIQNYLTKNYPQAYVRVKRYNLMYNHYPVDLMFRGNDPAVLRDLTAQAEKIMGDCPIATLPRNDWSDKAPSLFVNFAPVDAADAALTRSDVGLSLMAATEGIPVGVYNEGAHAMPIIFKTVDNNSRPSEGLDNIPVWSALPNMNILNEQTFRDVTMGVKGKSDLISDLTETIPLEQLTDGISLNWEEPVVKRYDSQRAMRAQCNVAIGHTAEQVRQALLPEINKIKLPEGYSVEWLGEYDASSQAKSYLFANLPLAVVLIILILILLFKDFKKPLIIILCIPLAFIGISGAMLISGKEFGFVAIVGALGLIGMMIKNGVVLIDEITLLIEDGMNPFDALVEASMLRFRPVVLASFTTILGMIPLVADNMFGSMAVTIMGGLSVGTGITLIGIPLFYALFFKIKATTKDEK